MDNILDHVVVQGQRYDIVSPTAFGDNIETIGSACINPDGYAQGSTFLARLGNEQFYYEATAAITQGSSILEGTNCKKTTVTGREAELASEIETLGETVDSLNEAFTNQSFANGAVNLLPNKGTTQTLNGVTFTVNNDGTINANGTATQEFDFYFVPRSTGADKTSVPKGSYKLTGCPSGASNYSLKLTHTVNNVGEIIGYDTGNGLTFSLLTEGDALGCAIHLGNGAVLSNVTFKPMITLADMPDSDYAHYVPYAMANRELTESKAEKSDLTSISITGTTNNTGATIASGIYFYLNGQLVKAKVDIANNATLTANTNYEVVTAGALNALTVKNKQINGGSISANSIETFEDSSLGGKILAGYALLGVSTYNLSVTQVFISSNAFSISIKNNGSSSVTVNTITVFYIG